MRAAPRILGVSLTVATVLILIAGASYLLAIALRLPRAWPLPAWARVAGFVVVPMGERELVERFGEVYEEYRRRTPALVPRLVRRTPGP